MSDTRHIIAVFGATGAQGGSVADALLSDGTFKVRAITRNPMKKNAKRLHERGAELVRADLDDDKSLRTALKDVYGVFLVTDYWEHMDKEREVMQGRRVAELCRSLKIKHAIFSSLENAKELSGGRLEVPHFDGKGEINDYFREIGIPVTSVRMPSYFENFLGAYRPVRSDDENCFILEIPIGGVPLHGMSVRDLGGVVLSILKSPEEYIGKDIGLSTDHLTIAEYAAIMSKHTGKTIKPSKLFPEDYEKLDFCGAYEAAGMFKLYMMGLDRDKEMTRKLNPKAVTFEEWMLENKNLLNLR
ncbi:nmrA-like family domain-containing protein 1 [Protopterus annectens]|uniref:nmrA-like family domain-containing protein 1 n=1 Tax=Protopterus annectens TaxID=7888 RepID=UPI001CFBC610|nr:nmrA-like family domain-containing protein 1 [Protopterus annectens]